MTTGVASDQTQPSSAMWPWYAMIVAGVVTLTASFVVPPDAIQEQLSRILYVHVPAAWLAYVSFGVTMLASAMYLWRKTNRSILGRDRCRVHRADACCRDDLGEVDMGCVVDVGCTAHAHGDHVLRVSRLPRPTPHDRRSRSQGAP